MPFLLLLFYFYIETELKQDITSVFLGDHNTTLVVSWSRRGAMISPNPREFYCLNVVDSLYNNEKPDMCIYWTLQRWAWNVIITPSVSLESVQSLKHTFLVYVLVWSQFRYLFSPGFSMTYFKYFGPERLWCDTNQLKNVCQIQYVIILTCTSCMGVMMKY